MTPTFTDRSKPTAVVTGGSRGLGRALSATLLRAGWRVVIDGRDPARLADALDELGTLGDVIAVTGDVAEPAHREELATVLFDAGDGVQLLVNNASVLGPSPQPRLLDYPLDVLEQVYAVNVIAPLALVQLLGPALVRGGGRVIDISSDAAVEAYEGWGGYGSSKAALDQVSAVLAAEESGLRVYSFDPGDMATDLHQQAAPGEDISDLPSPESVVPALMRLVEGDLPSARYRVTDLLAPVTS